MRGIYAKLFDLLDPAARRRFFGLLGLMLATGITEAVSIGSMIPFLGVLSRPELVQENAWLASAYEAGDFASEQDFLVSLGIGVFCLFLFSIGVRTLTQYSIARFAHMRAYDLSTRMLAGYLDQPYAWFLNRHSSDLSKTILNEVRVVINGAMLPALRLIAYSIVALSIMTLVIAVEPGIALTAAAVIGGCYALLYAAARRLLSRLGRQRLEADGVRYQVVQEATSGIKDVKMLGIEKALDARFRGPARRQARAEIMISVIAELPRNLLEAVLFGGMMLLVLVMMLTRPGGISEVIPVIGLYAFAGARLFPVMQQIYQVLTRLRFQGAALDALHADLAQIEAGRGGVGADEPAPLGLSRGFALRGVRYAYPAAERAALRGLDLEVAARTTVGIVGGTGAGKTTTIDVILGLLEPQEGVLEVDGEVVAGARLRAWRRTIGYVPQSIFLADDTVAANIAFGLRRDRIDRAAVERAARIAELHRFVEEELPLGYDTRVGERGVRLSGGQRQRIGIARALYRDPAVLVLDEATSSLDTVTERAVMDAVRNLAHAKTIVMIAHRLSTVRDCDEIFLLEHGRVAARGSFERLLAESPAFRAMAEGVS
jgi:ABC-type multidrug transport system fused ATPase/permease subunit